MGTFNCWPLSPVTITNILLGIIIFLLLVIIVIALLV